MTHPIATGVYVYSVLHHDYEQRDLVTCDAIAERASNIKRLEV